MARGLGGDRDKGGNGCPSTRGQGRERDVEQLPSGHLQAFFMLAGGEGSLDCPYSLPARDLENKPPPVFPGPGLELSADASGGLVG